MVIGKPERATQNRIVDLFHDEMRFPSLELIGSGFTSSDAVSNPARHICETRRWRLAANDL